MINFKKLAAVALMSVIAVLAQSGGDQWTGYWTIEDGTLTISGAISNPNITIYGTFGSYKDGITKLEIGNYVGSIAYGAFKNWGGLESVIIGNSVKSIGSDAFSGCSRLTAINVEASNNNYTSVDGVLFNKSKTTLIQYPTGKTGAYAIPDSVTSIGGGAFSGCRGLTSVTIGNSVTSIGDTAFSGCSVTSVTIGNSVTSIGDRAFYNCSGLTQLDFNATNCTNIGRSVFDYCSKLTQLNIGNNVTNIPDNAFSSCYELTGTLTIPNSVTSIGSAAFQSCGVTLIIIPNSVTFIGDNAFLYCDNLKQVINLRTTPQTINFSMFAKYFPTYNTPIEVYVPAQSVDAYKAADVWNGFNIMKCPFISNRTDIVLFTGETKTLEAASIEKYADGDNIKWEVDNSVVVSLSGGGNIKAQSVGTTAVTATVLDGAIGVQYTVSVQKRTPQYSVPENLTATYGQTLADVKLPAGWSWGNALTPVGDAGTRIHYANFTPTDTANYNIMTINLSVSVAKAKITKPVVYATRVYTGNPQSAGIVPNAAYEVSGDIATDVGIHTAYVELLDKTNYEWNDGTTTNITLTWQIVKAGAKEIKVVWGEKRQFVYNKMVQVPQWSIEPAEIDKNHLRVMNAQSQTGKYTKENNLAPFIMIIPEFNDGNYCLTNTSVDYEITKKPLDIILKDNKGNVGKEISVSRKPDITVGGALDSLKAFIVYNGFAIDTVNKQADNAANSLSGEPTFEVYKLESETRSRSTRGEVLKISDLLENGEYTVNIKVSDIFAQNYELSEGRATIKVSDLFVDFSMSRDGDTPIRDKKKPDNKHGILLEKAIVSQSAKISVKTPEQAQITLAVYDNTGNVIYKTSGKSTETFIWNLTNAAGRNVANGTYLVVVEAKGAKGSYAYSAKVGVKR